MLSEADCFVLDRRAFHSTFGTSVVVAFAIFLSSAARVIPALLAVPIQHDQKWPQLYLTAPIATCIAVTALGAPLAARALSRLGVRSTLFISLVLLAASLALSSLAASPWHLLLLWGVGVGLSGSLSASILGAMMGFRDDAVHCGTTFGQFNSAQLLGSAAGLLMASRAAEALGWRPVLCIGAAATLFTALVVICVLHAGDGRACPMNSAVPRAQSRSLTSSKGSILILAAIFFICGSSSAGLIDGSLGVLCMGNGLGLSSSADVLVMVAVSGGVGSVASGFLADHYAPRKLLTIYFVARALALLWLPFSSLNIVQLAALGSLFGLDAALTFPALVKLLSRHVEQQAAGEMMSWMMMSHMMGVAITSAAVGVLGLAGYAVSFTLVGSMCLFAAGLVRITDEQHQKNFENTIGALPATLIKKHAIVIDVAHKVGTTIA